MRREQNQRHSFITSAEVVIFKQRNILSAICGKDIRIN